MTRHKLGQVELQDYLTSFVTDQLRLNINPRGPLMISWFDVNPAVDCE